MLISSAIFLYYLGIVFVNTVLLKLNGMEYERQYVLLLCCPKANYKPMALFTLRNSLSYIALIYPLINVHNDFSGPGIHISIHVMQYYSIYTIYPF